jgi:hypothetical protein
VIHGSTVHLKAKLTAAKAGEAAAGQTGPGFMHVYLDGKIVSIEIASVNEVTDQAIHGLTPGQHLLRAEFGGAQPPALPPACDRHRDIRGKAVTQADGGAASC